MKAKFVNFKRNLDPKKSLELGIHRKIVNPEIEEWETMPAGYYLVYDEMEKEYAIINWDLKSHNFCYMVPNDDYAWNKDKDSLMLLFSSGDLHKNEERYSNSHWVQYIGDNEIS